MKKKKDFALSHILRIADVRTKQTKHKDRQWQSQMSSVDTSVTVCPCLITACCAKAQHMIKLFVVSF